MEIDQFMVLVGVAQMQDLQNSIFTNQDCGAKMRTGFKDIYICIPWRMNEMISLLISKSGTRSEHIPSIKLKQDFLKI